MLSVELVTSCFSPCVILLTTVAALAVFYLLYTPTRASGRRNQNSKSDTNSCHSPNCVRCSRRPWKKEELLDRLQNFEDTRKTGPEYLIRLFKAIGRELALPETKEPTVFYLYKLVPQVAWHDSTYGSDLEALTSLDNFRAIKLEFLNLYEHHSEHWARNTVGSGAWRVCHLYNQGKRVEKVCSMCPRTAKVLEGIGPFKQPSAFTNAVFSVMEAGTHITPHCGPTNCRLHCHLPLVVPDGCVLKVNGEERAWVERRLLLFDDSYIHEAWHRGTKDYRAVLMVDLWHPGLTEVEKEAMQYLFSPSGII